jgi:hypothetical protein
VPSVNALAGSILDNSKLHPQLLIMLARVTILKKNMLKTVVFWFNSLVFYTIKYITINRFEEKMT